MVRTRLRPAPKLGAAGALLVAALALGAALADARAQSSPDAFVELPGHVVALPRDATPRARTKVEAGDEPVTLTVVLRREREPAFLAWLEDIADPSSPNHRRVLAPAEQAERFGPSAESYALVRAHFERAGFELVHGSANRLTLTLRGTRAQAEDALGVAFGDWRLGERSFRTNENEPALPRELAWRVQAIAGLSTYARPRPQFEAIGQAACAALKAMLMAAGSTPADADSVLAFLKCKPSPFPSGGPPPPPPSSPDESQTLVKARSVAAGVAAAPNPDWLSVTGAGQKVGILSFDSYHPQNVADYFALLRTPALAAQVSRVAVNGGVSPGPDEKEVLLDIAAVLGIAPGAQVVVYDAPFTGGGTSFQTLLNAMIGDGVTIISNSWAYCESQTTFADVASIDSIFASAAAAGISAFNASGDSGSTCLDGSPDTVAVPASSPNATAVGGTTLALALGGVYGSETWWDGSAATPATGQGGYGVSKFFARPTWQASHVAGAKRSVPDVATNADPAKGVILCQSNDGGCPTGLLYGGTSMSAPLFAAYAALLNESLGTNVGAFNAAIYPHAATPAFRDASSMGSDFAHVGLGSPNLDVLALKLKGATTGPASASKSTVVWTGIHDGTEERPPLGAVPADGATQAVIVVQVRDANGHAIPGRTISLAPGVGSSAVISPPTATMTVDAPYAVFTVTNLVAEKVTLTATNLTDAQALAQKSIVTFGVPPAAAASIVAAPTLVLNDGAASTTITVTLVDALARPTPGKQVSLSQGAGRSVVTGPSPAVTDVNGQIAFVATNRIAEVVTYTAVDVTDGNLPVPGSAVVTFSGTADSSCAVIPTAAPGFVLEPWSTGYASAAFFFSGVNYGCGGASNPAFLPDGDALVSQFPDGKFFRLPAEGGIAGSGTRIATLGPTFQPPVVGQDGRVYTSRSGSGAGFFTGSVHEIDPDDGTILRTLATGLSCPGPLSVDPKSGDLFVTGACFGAGTDEARLFRIADPAGAATLSVYVTLPFTPNGAIAFAPNGDLYVQTGYLLGAPPVYKVGPTDGPQPPSLAAVSGLNAIYWVQVVEALPGGAAKTLVVNTATGLQLADLTTVPPTLTPLTVGGASSGVVGPDGCLYISGGDIVFRVTTSTGACSYATTQPALVLAPPAVSPDPAQGATQAFTATFANLAAPAGTPVTFVVQGANPQVRLGATDANGVAAMSYAGIATGEDRVHAFADVGGTTFTSNTTVLTWVAGRRATALAIVSSATAGITGTTVALAATLHDQSVEPQLPVAGATIDFTLGAAGCSAITDAGGTATCSVAAGAIGAPTLTAAWAGDATYAPSSASRRFLVLAAPPAADVAANPASVDFGTIALPGTSAVVAVTIENVGSTTLTLSSIVLGGAHPGDFALGAGAGACVAGGTLAPTATCTLYPTFTPTALGARAATVTVTDSGAAVAVVVSLAGTGAPPPTACFSGALPGGGMGNACVSGPQPACRFASAQFVTTGSVGVPPPTGVTLPWGLFAFTAIGCGGSATLTLSYPDALPPNASYWKYGPRPSLPAAWYALPASVAGTTMTVAFVDGGAGDGDLAVNGSITDPGGVGVLAVAGVAAPVPATGPFALALTALLLAVLALIARPMRHGTGRRRARR